SDADRSFQASLRVWNQQQDDSSKLNLASCEHGRAMVALKQSQYTTALTLFRRAYGLRKTRLKADHRLIGHSLEMIGVTLSLLGEKTDGLRHLEQAVKTLQSFWGPEHEEVAEAKHELALALVRKGDVAGSMQAMNASRHGYRRHMAATLVGLEQQAQLQYLNVEKHRVMDGLAMATQQPENLEQKRVGWEWLLNNKGFSFEVLAQQRLLARSKRGQNSDASRANRLAEVRRELAVLANSKSDVINASLSANEQLLARSLGIGGEFGIASWATAKDVQRAIPDGTVLLDFALIDRNAPSDSAFGFQPVEKGEGRYVAWIVTRSSIKFVELGQAAEIESAVKAARDAILSAKSLFEKRRFRRAQDLVDGKLQALSKLLLHPLEDDIASSTNVVLSPDGALWLLPWPALLASDGEYLVEKVETSCVVSARQLLGRQGQQSRDYAVIMANPDYGLDSNGVRAELRKAKVRDDMFPTRTMQIKGDSKAMLRDVAALPGTQAEAETAKPFLDRLTDGKTYVYTQRQALESFVKVIKRPRIAVFATHGFLLKDDDAAHPLDRSGLVFAGVNSRRDGGDGDDGILTALEVLDCDFRGTQLVMLSACDSALGRNQVGEGIAGLQQAFHLAGAEQVVATLWPIDDRETQVLMKNVWENLANGEPLKRALRRAQLDYIKNVEQRLGYANPWLWAGTMLTSY
ncbi:MAG: CHAT domain-containing protein, partial [Planctomycetaceae bacterium]